MPFCFSLVTASKKRPVAVRLLAVVTLHGSIGHADGDNFVDKQSICWSLISSSLRLLGIFGIYNKQHKSFEIRNMLEVKMRTSRFERNTGGMFSERSGPKQQREHLAASSGAPRPGMD